MNKWIVSIGIGFLLIISGCSQAEEIQQTATINNLEPESPTADEELQKIANLITSSNLNGAEKALQSAKHYNEKIDFIVLSNYKTALRTEQNHKDDNIRMLKYLANCFAYIPSDYTGILRDEILEKKRQFENEIILLIQAKKYEEVTQIFFNSKDTMLYSSIYNYTVFLKNEKADIKNATGFLSDISNNYNGLFSQEIKEAKQKYRIWITEWESYNSLKAKQKPHVGLTREQLENSSWGKPEKINTTTTETGTTEQWVYGNGKYAYLDDNGFVTAIQE